MKSSLMSKILSLIGRVTISACLAMLMNPVFLMAQECSSFELGRIQKTHEQGYFRQTLVDIHRIQCFPDRIKTTDERILSHELLAVSYLAQNQPDSARRWVKSLIRHTPSYRSTNPVHPYLYRQMIRKEKRRWNTYRWIYKGTKWYHWAGRLAIGAGITYGTIKLLEPGPATLDGAPPFPDIN